MTMLVWLEVWEMYCIMRNRSSWELMTYYVLGWQVSFLQTQLKEAASRIAYYTSEVEKNRTANNSLR